MSEHETSIEITDGSSKYGRRKRQWTAVCSCGWRSSWSPVSKRAAQEHADDHATQSINR